MIIYKELTFDSAHKLINDNGECANLHGHTYILRLYLKGPVDPKTGYVFDFKELKKIIKKNVLDVIDHQYLNDFVENPSVENMCVWIWDHLKQDIPILDKVKLCENPSNCGLYSGENQ
jgi:6-pyruvoyltetrahydropterin/6-carboxytetrahydropterin synthase